MLSIQKSTSTMEQDFSQGINPSPYDQDRQRRGAWNEQAPFSTAYPSDPITQLPPIQTQRTAFDQSPTSYDPVRRPTPIATTMGQSFSPYATQQPPQSPYGHGISPYQHNPHMFNQYPASSFSPIRPMPALATGQPPHSMSASYASPTGYTFQSQGEDPEPQQRLLHVVGSQGRRGVLPSDEGRPSAVANGATGTKSTIIPKKDADGKFPCPHCQKTYLHGKHLKRHLLRREFSPFPISSSYNG